MGGGALSSDYVSKLGSKEVIRHAELVSASQLQERYVSSRNNKTLSRISKFTSFTKKFNPLPEVEGKCAFTLAEGATHVDTCDGKRKIAFTLAEVLITLGIIGVVVALTLPSFISKYKGYVTANKLRQVYSLLKQAESMAVNEYGDMKDWDFIDTKTMAGIYPGLNTLVFDKYYKPYLKTTKCNYNAQIKAANGTRFITIEKWYNYVCLPDGVVIYGNTLGGTGYLGSSVYVDLNGKKTPNVVGQDIFTFLINRPVYKSDDYNTSTYRVASKCPVGLSTCFAGDYHGGSGYYWDGDEKTLVKYCLGGSTDFYTLASGGNSCAYMIEQAGWKIPKNYPIKI